MIAVLYLCLTIGHWNRNVCTFPSRNRAYVFMEVGRRTKRLYVT